MLDIPAAVAARRSTTLPGGGVAATCSAAAMSHRSSRSWGCSLGGEAYAGAAEQPRVICPLATQLRAAVNEPSGLAAKSADNRLASSCYGECRRSHLSTAACGTRVSVICAAGRGSYVH